MLTVKKAVCIKDGIFDYNIELFEVKKGEVYSYYNDGYNYNVQDKNNNQFYPIIGFNKYFIDIIEYRIQKIKKLLNDTCYRK